MQGDLIDRIYEASVVPELWPSVLDEIAVVADARGGLLFSARKVLHWTASGSVRDVFEEYVNDGWFTRCPRRICIFNQPEPSFFVEQDFWSEEQISENPIYRDFFRRHGLGWSAGTGLQVPTGDNIVFSIERAFERGPIEREHVERLNALRPHLARSALVTARLGLQRAQGAADALRELRLPALLLNETGAVIETNELFDAMPEQVTYGANNRLILGDARAQEMLTTALKAIGQSSEAGQCTFPLRDGAGKAIMVLHVMPIKRSAQDIFAQSFALLMMTPVSSDRAPSPALLRSLFDLTPSEARVAEGVAVGRTLEEIAEAGEVSITTVRSQMRKVLEKTGCSRQAEVAALLAKVTLAPG